MNIEHNWGKSTKNCVCWFCLGRMYLVVRSLRLSLSLLIMGLFLAASLLTAGCSKKDDSSKYNVLLVTLDTTRTERLTCYGHQSLTIPTLDQLAREGWFNTSNRK